MDKVSGIYCIVHIDSGKTYVGSAVNITDRWYKHKKALRKGDHHNQRLQNAWNKYGEDAFAFSVLEPISNAEELLKREQHYIDVMNPFYNIAPIAGSMLGYRHTKEAKEKFRQRMLGSQIRKGKPHPEDVKKRYSEQRKGQGKGRTSPMLGRKHSAETIAKMRESHKNRPPRSQETLERMRQANIGRKHTQEAKEKMRKAKQGRTISLEQREHISNSLKGREFSPETRAKLSAANKGKKNSLGSRRSEEARQKQSTSMLGNTRGLGKKRSEETKAKTSASIKAWHAERKRKKLNEEAS